LLAHYQPMKPDTGRLARIGREVKFIADPRGSLKVYRHPSKDQAWGIYLVGADPTHTTVGDEACAQVINRRTMEQAAVLNAHLDPIEFGKQLYLLGEWYNMALIAPEAEGPGYATVGHLLGANYPFVYESQKLDKTPGKVNMDVFGWRTNSTTKHAAIGRLVNLLAQPLVKIGNTVYGLLIHDLDTFTEMKNYVTDDHGGFMNGDGTLFDDCVMALGIATAVHFIEPPLPPYTRDDSHLTVVREAIAKVDPSLVRAGQTMVVDSEPDPADIDHTPAWRLEVEEDET
jgi:phage terminase large subunit